MRNALIKYSVFALLLCFSLPAQAEKVLDIQSLETDSGIDIWLVEDHNTPIIALDFSMPGGLALDDMDMPGRAYLVSILLDEGAGDMDSQTFQKALADQSISLGFSAGRDFFTGGLKTLTHNLDTAANLLNLALTEPRFDADAIARMKQSTKASIQQNLSDPGWIAARSYNGLLFEGSAYSLPGQGTLESLEEISRKDLQSFTKSQFVKQNLKVAIAGDITTEDAKALVSRIFDDLPKDSPEALPKNNVEFQNLGKIFLYHFSNPQTHIIAGHKGIAVTDEDWPTAQLINYSLGGGGFDSRLMEEIREKRGLTYGVSSYLASMKHAPMIQVSLSTSSENAAESLSILKKEWARMATTGPTEEELENAKSYLTGSLLLNLTSTDSIASALNGLQQYGFDADYINRRNDRLNAVTIDQARVVAGRLLDPDELMTITVGEPAGLEPDKHLKSIPGMPDTGEETDE
jgi:zinc protease